MAETDPKGGTPVTESEPKGVRFPEDELADLERKAGEGASDQATEGGKGEEAGAGQDPDDASVAKLQELMVKKGIKDLGALVDHFSGLESTNTRLSQDVQRLSAVTSPGNQPGGERPAPRVSEEAEIELPDNPMDLVLNKETLRSFVKKLDERAMARATAVVEQRRQADEARTTQERVDRKRAEDPEKFERLRPRMVRLSIENPKADLDTVFSMAERQEQSEEAQLMDRVKKNLGIDGQDAARLKAALARAGKTGTISGGTGKQVDMAGDRDKEDKALLKAIMDSDKV